MFGLATTLGDMNSYLVAHRSMGVCLHQQGEFVPARQHFERILALYDPNAHFALASAAAYDMRASALGYLSIEAFILGYPAQAVARMEQALIWSRKLGHRHSLAVVLIFAALLNLFLGADDAANAELSELIGVATECSFAYWLALANTMRGHVLAIQGDAVRGLALAREGLAAEIATGSTFNQTYFLGLVAQNCERAGHDEEAFDVFNRALEFAGKTGERWFEAELHRLKGEWFASSRRSAQTDAETCFACALGIAEDQRAMMWKLRAATSLARLWRDQGKRTEARDLLTPIYGWFTEGFDTRDLKEAKALLEQLAASTDLAV
jgi:predicted ATPase